MNLWFWWKIFFWQNWTSTDRSAKIRNVIDVSDDFFDLTIEDAKRLLSDVRKQQKEFNSDEKTLMTKGGVYIVVVFLDDHDKISYYFF